MEVDTVTSANQAPVKHLLPELEIFCYLLVLLFLIDQKKYNEVGWCVQIYLFLFFIHYRELNPFW
jgi:26S proteasome regulatory subunit N3